MDWLMSRVLEKFYDCLNDPVVDKVVLKFYVVTAVFGGLSTVILAVDLLIRNNQNARERQTFFEALDITIQSMIHVLTHSYRIRELFIAFVLSLLPSVLADRIYVVRDYLTFGRPTNLRALGTYQAISLSCRDVPCCNQRRSFQSNRLQAEVKFRDSMNHPTIKIVTGIQVVLLNDDRCILDRDHCRTTNSHVCDNLTRTVKLYSFIRYFKNTTVSLANTPNPAHGLYEVGSQVMKHRWTYTHETFIDALQYKKMDRHSKLNVIDDVLHQTRQVAISYFKPLIRSSSVVTVVKQVLSMVVDQHLLAHRYMTWVAFENLCLL